MIGIDIIRKKRKTAGTGGNSVGSEISTPSGGDAQNAVHADDADHANRAGEAVHASSAKELDGTSSVWNTIRTWISNAKEGLGDLFLRKDQDDETKHKLTMKEAAVKGALTVGGEATVDTLHSKGFDGASEDSMEHGKGFGMVEKDGAGKIYTDFLHVRNKAYFEELETRVLSRVGGDYLFTKAGSKIVYVEPHNEVGEVITDETTDKTVKSYRCYYLQDDGTTQTMNNWSVGDFARCQVTNIKQGVSQHASNRYYTRLVLAVSTAPEVVSAFGDKETKKYGWVDLAANEVNDITVKVGDTNYTYTCEDSIDLGDGNDAPMAEDAIVQIGNVFAQDTEHTNSAYKKRGNVLLLSATSGGIYIYNGINVPEKDKMTDFQSQQIDTDRVRFRSDLFQVAPWAAPNDSATLFCLRGDYSAEATYGKGDVVLYGGQLWCCTSGKPVKGIAPDSTDGAKYWAVYTAKGADGKDGKDGKSARRTAVVSLTSDRGTVFNGSYDGVLLQCRVLVDGKSMGGRIPRDNFAWSKDDTEDPNGQKGGGFRYRIASSSDALDLWKCNVKIPKRLLEPIELTAIGVDGTKLIFRASEDISGMKLYPCWKRHYKIRRLEGRRNAWGFHDMAHDGKRHHSTPLQFTSLGDNNYSVDMSLLLSFVESHNIVLHKTAKVTTEKAALKHGAHTYWLKQGTDGKYHAWGRYGVWLADSNYTPISTIAKCKIYVETDSDTSTTGTASLSV